MIKKFYNKKVKVHNWQKLLIAVLALTFILSAGALALSPHNIAGAYSSGEHNYIAVTGSTCELSGNSVNLKITAGEQSKFGSAGDFYVRAWLWDNSQAFHPQTREHLTEDFRAKKGAYSGTNGNLTMVYINLGETWQSNFQFNIHEKVGGNIDKTKTYAMWLTFGRIYDDAIYIIDNEATGGGLSSIYTYKYQQTPELEPEGPSVPDFVMPDLPKIEVEYLGNKYHEDLKYSLPCYEFSTKNSDSLIFRVKGSFYYLDNVDNFDLAIAESLGGEFEFAPNNESGAFVVVKDAWKIESQGSMLVYYFDIMTEGNKKEWTVYVDAMPSDVFYLDALEVYGVPYLNEVELPEDPVKVGHTFVGWYYDAKLTQAYKYGDIITEDTELFAKFEKNKYNVNYFVNGVLVQTKVVEYDVKAENINLSETGYNFSGWSLDADGVASYDFESNTILDNLNLYATKSVIMLQVTFKIGSEVYSVLNVPYGSTLAEVSKASGASIFTSFALNGTALASDTILTDSVELQAQLADKLGGWLTFGLWWVNNWYWVVIGIAGVIILAIVIVIIYKRN